MENSYLNMAHQTGRRAEKHLKSGHYDAAIECHQQAADLLQAAINKITIPASLQCLQLQRDYHIKYKELVRMKRNQFEKYIRTMEQQNQNQPDVSGRTTQGRIEKSCQLQFSIYKTMEDTDILLEQLSQGNENTKQATGTTASRPPKSDAEADTKIQSENGVIEELRTLNHQLHILVYALVSQMDDCNRETDALREQVLYFQTHSLAGAAQRKETKRGSIPPIPNPSLVSKDPPTTLVTTSQSLPKQQQHEIELESPILCGELPPLEMPKFDFEEINN